jgi:hypothetical protein
MISAARAADGTLNVRWQGRDADGDALTYRVRLSTDGGQTWQLVGIDLDDESLNVPLSGMRRGGASPLVEILVSDGLHVSSSLEGSPVVE